MKTNILKLSTIVLIFIGIGYVPVYSQVTVGSDNPSAKAALLEIKSEETANPGSVTDVTNITSRIGGLGLPRVMLENKTTLEPFIPNNSDWTNNVGKVKEKHAGLMVYNIYVAKEDSSNDGSNPNTQFKQGLYVWDGTQWVFVGEGANERYFYIPSFNIDLTKSSPFDLYGEYSRQFTKLGNSQFVSSNPNLQRIPSPNNTRLYERSELDYVITYYDTNVLGNVSVDNEGKMYYTVKTTNTTPESFLNVVFVIK
jgi:hypothetical protein